MEQNEVVKRIREYHIIRDIMKEKSVIRLAGDPNMSGLLAAFNSYVEFFGRMRMSNVESFDQFFSRLEKNYLATSTHAKIKPNETAYIQYIKDILGKSGLAQITTVANDPDNTARIRALRLDVGKEVRETNSIILARDIKLYSVVSGLRGNLTEVIRKNGDLEAELEKVRGILKLTKENAKTKEEVLAEIDASEEAILASVVANAAESDYLSKAIAKSTGKKINEVRDLIIAASGASRTRDVESQKRIAAMSKRLGGLYAGIGGVSKSLGGVHRKLNKIDNSMTSAHTKLDGLESSMASVHTKLDEISARVDRKSRGATFWKVAAGFGGGVGVTALVAALIASGGDGSSVIPGNVDTSDAAQVESAYVEFVDSVNEIGVVLQNMLLDGDYTKEEQTSFEAAVDSFVAKFAGTKFEGESAENANTFKSLSSSIAGMSEDKRLAIANYAALLVDFNAVNTTLENYKTQNADLIKSNDGLKASIDALTAKVGDLQNEIIKLQEVIATTDNVKTIQELQAKVEAYENRIAELEAEVQRVTGENTTLTAANNMLQTQVETLTAENQKLSGELEQAKADLATAQKSVADLTKEKEELQAKYDAGVITEKELRDRIAALEKSESELKTQVENLTKQVADLNKQLADEINKYNTLLENYNKIDGEKTALAAELKKAQDEIASLKSQIESLTVDSAELILTIYEYMTGESTTDISKAMDLVSTQLGITVTNPSTGLEGNVKQP